MTKRILSVALATAALAAASSAVNLLPDGSFELSGSAARNVLSSSWTTDLDARLGPGNGPSDPGSLYDESTYIVANGINPFTVHNLFRTDLAAQNGSKYMIVNGSVSASKRVLQTAAPIAVAAGTQYYFQGYAASVYPDAPAQLMFKVDYLNAASAIVNTGTGMLTAPAFADGWKLIGFDSTAGVGAVSARISIWNSQTAAGGNDFALDNLSFQTEAVPEPATVAALGLGALGMLRRRRRA